MLKQLSASLSIGVDVGRNGAFTFAVLVPVEAARRLARRRDTCQLVGVQRGDREPRRVLSSSSSSQWCSHAN